MREVDRLTTERYGIPSLSLMEDAGERLPRLMARRFRRLESRRIVVLCGKGNNGGDGFVTARHLADAGTTPIVILVAAQDEMRGDAAVNRDRWQKSGGEVRVVLTSSDWQRAKPSVNSADLIVDALLGTGVKGPVEGLLSEVIHEVNGRDRGKVVIAVDIPSGLPADINDARESNAGTKDSSRNIISADCTVTFTAPKVGMFFGNAAAYVGQLIVREIGSPPELVEEVGKGNCALERGGRIPGVCDSSQAPGTQGRLRARADRGGVRGKKRGGGAGVVVGAASGSGISDRSDAGAGAAIVAAHDIPRR